VVVIGIVGIITTYAISVYHRKLCEFKSRPGEFRLGEVYSLQPYVIKVFNNLRQGDDFLRVLKHHKS
jgi:hypothetical protein